MTRQSTGTPCTFKLIILIISTFTVCMNITPAVASDDLDKRISYNENILAGLREAVRAVEDAIEMAEDPNTWFITYPAPVPPVAVPRDQFIKYYTWSYVTRLKREGKTFDKNELAKIIKYHRDMSDAVKKQLPKELADLKKDIARYENETAALMAERDRLRGGKAVGAAAAAEKTFAAGSSKVCVEFTGVTRVGKLGERADVTGDPNTMRQEWNSPRGWRGDVTLEWTRPPARICDGDTFTFESTITNHRPYPRDPGGTAGHINFKPSGKAVISMECNNPDPWDPISDVYLKATESKKSNRCTVRLRISGFGTPEALFEVGLRAGDTGLVYYNYRNIGD